MRVVIVYKYEAQALSLALELYEDLQGKGIVAKMLDSNRLVETTDRTSVDLVFVFGGDGTLLQAARFFAGVGAPIVGVNLGKVGFLCGIEPENLSYYVDAILQQQYKLDARMMINVNLTRGNKALYRGLALNDIVLKTCLPHTTQVKMTVNGRFHTNYKGDGIICATPTGSTAYSFSAGGPVIDADLEALVITPICSYLSSARSLVVSGSSKLAFELDSENSTEIYVDGQEGISLMKGDLVQIERSALVTNFVQVKRVMSLEKIKYKKSKQLLRSSAR